MDPKCRQPIKARVASHDNISLVLVLGVCTLSPGESFNAMHCKEFFHSYIMWSCKIIPESNCSIAANTFKAVCAIRNNEMG